MIAGHKTSISLEDKFWSALKEAAAHRGMTLTAMVGEIQANRQHGNLSSAIRTYLLGLYSEQAEEISHTKSERERLSAAAHYNGA